MTNILLLLIILSNLLLFGLFVYAFARVRAVYTQFRLFVTPIEEGKPSPLAQTTQVLADMLGRSLVAHIKGTFLGKQSGDARAQTAVSADIAQDSMAGSPIGAILESFPSLKKSIRRNPQLLDIALQFLSKNKQAQSLPGGNGSSGSQIKFKL